MLLAPCCKASRMRVRTHARCRPHPPGLYQLPFTLPPGRPALLDRCLRRMEWERHKEREAQEAADEAERERQAVQVRGGRGGAGAVRCGV